MILGDDPLGDAQEEAQILTLEPRQHVPCNSVYAGVLLCQDASTT
jgi:hypothetical protein